MDQHGGPQALRLVQTLMDPKGAAREGRDIKDLMTDSGWVALNVVALILALFVATRCGQKHPLLNLLAAAFFPKTYLVVVLARKYLVPEDKGFCSTLPTAQQVAGSARASPAWNGGAGKPWTAGDGAGDGSGDPASDLRGGGSGPVATRTRSHHVLRSSARRQHVLRSAAALGQ